MLDLALVDVRMPDAQIEGIETARYLGAQGVRCVMLTSHTDAQTRFAALLAGALGYLVKDVASDTLVVEMVAQALQGDPLPDPLDHTDPDVVLAGQRHAAWQEAQWDLLTPAQRPVAELAAAGKTNEQIAQALGVELSTVHSHMQEVLARLDLVSRRAVRDRLYSTADPS